MKTLRYRIRVIAFVLVAALVAVTFMCVRSFLPQGDSSSQPETPFESPAESVLPEQTPFPESSPSDDPSATTDPLYNTYGL